MKSEYHGKSDEIVIPPEMDNSPVSLYISDMWDGHDPWGSAMAEGFAVCDFLYAIEHDGQIPDSMGYRPAMAGPDSDDFMFQMISDGFMAGYFSTADLISYAEILDSFLDECKAKGLDY